MQEYFGFRQSVTSCASPSIGHHNANTRIQVRELIHPARKPFELELRRCLENL